MSTFSKIKELDSGLERLEEDLENNYWYTRYGDLQKINALDTGYIVAVWDNNGSQSEEATL